MSNVLQFSKRLNERAVAGSIVGIELRHFRDPGDIPLWLDLRNRAFARAKPGVVTWTSADFAAEFLTRTWWASERIWLAVPTAGSNAEAPVLGTVSLADRVTSAGVIPAIHWLAVHPAWRRRGLGRLLLTALEAQCWDLGHRELFLETHAGWTAACQLYESLGYQVVSSVLPAS